MILKVGIIQGFYGGGGGTEKTLDTIIEALVENNDTVNLYTFSKPTKVPKGVNLHSLLPFSLPYFGLYQRFMESSLIKKAKDDDLVIQASGGISIPANKKQKLVIYCHNDFQNEQDKQITKYKGIWKWYYKPYQKLSKNFIQKINNNNIILASNSKFVQESIKTKFGKDSIVIYPPVNIEEFNKNSSKQNKVVTVSRYSQEKNLEFAINTMKNINHDYTIVGNTKTKSNIVYYDKLKTKVQENNLGIKLLKNLKRSNLIQELESSKIYFHPSPETFGITIIESIAAGCIPIVPNNSAHRETIPIQELRYKEDDIGDAQEKIIKAINGEFDSLSHQLKHSIQKYDKVQFKKSIIAFIEESLH